MTKPVFYRLPNVETFAGVCKSTIYNWMAKGEFPKPVRLGGRSVGWRTADLEAWAKDPQGWQQSEGAQ